MTTRNYSAAAMIMCLAMASTICDFGESLVVGSRQPFMRKRSSSMKMYIDDFMPSFSESLLPDAVTSMPTHIFTATSRLMMSDPQIESEVLSDVSVALDMSTLLTPNTAWLRLCNVIGRVLILSSDYIQDNHVNHDEWNTVHTYLMLAISTQLFVRSAWPLLLALFSTSTLTVRDRRAYALLFKSVGLTALQFKTLLTSNTSNWIEYSPNEEIELDGEYLYFLYSGEAVTPSIGTKTGNSSAMEAPGFAEEGLHFSTRVFGDVQFAKALEASLYKKTQKKSKSKKSTTTQDTTDSTLAPRDHFVVGSKGASMFRVSTSKLLKLMDNDDELSRSIQRLILLNMQEKLSSSSKKNASVHSSNSSSSSPNATVPAHV